MRDQRRSVRPRADFAGERSRARDRRRRPDLRHHHQSARGARRGYRHRRSRRRRDRRCGVRPVSSDRHQCRPRPRAPRDRGACVAKARCSSTDAASASCARCTKTPSSVRATSWPAPCFARSQAVAARFSIAVASGPSSPSISRPCYAACSAAGIDPLQAADPGRAGGALPHGRHPYRRAGPQHGRWAVGLRRGCLDRSAWGEPARFQLAARGRGVRRARGARRRRVLADGRTDKAARDSHPADGTAQSDKAEQMLRRPWPPMSAWSAMQARSPTRS